MSSCCSGVVKVSCGSQRGSFSQQKSFISALITAYRIHKHESAARDCMKYSAVGCKFCLQICPHVICSVCQCGDVRGLSLAHAECCEPLSSPVFLHKICRTVSGASDIQSLQAVLASPHLLQTNTSQMSASPPRRSSLVLSVFSSSNPSLFASQGTAGLRLKLVEEEEEVEEYI